MATRSVRGVIRRSPRAARLGRARLGRRRRGGRGSHRGRRTACRQPRPGTGAHGWGAGRRSRTSAACIDRSWAVVLSGLGQQTRRWLCILVRLYQLWGGQTWTMSTPGAKRVDGWKTFSQVNSKCFIRMCEMFCKGGGHCPLLSTPYPVHGFTSLSRSPGNPLTISTWPAAIRRSSASAK